MAIRFHIDNGTFYFGCVRLSASQKLFLYLFSYRAGHIFWKAKLSNKGRVKIGNELGGVDKDGYLVGSVYGKNWRVHRLIYVMFNGDIPEGMQIDHVDHNKLNNVLENLRLCTCDDNNRNMPMLKTNTSGVVGVTAKGNKWQAQIVIKGKPTYLGLYDDFFEAVCARKSAEKSSGVFHENHGK